ncbi:hypothetical protein [Snodgrassella alvi]|uniref:Transposase n=1 Tax=Snodgrassella alvi TaxID=1196083 RepID=A0A2N9XSR0_9NEIS|nr:hypothetical protein [Snodgrassella alvi]PIT51920.1 hypothetical protein BHC49_12600 [Snodgrassella alvi]PIT55905.1 hypothetical protein BHC49_05525 [Snodgrassella alvi]PIT56967.1 hypothetical protein BHC49_04035 [Snodgrassella alvi]PIT57659.1 hypothetical protein BHC49_03110 [Snodgrassella alvi]PIT57664.1 hypothetical protein BHC49_03075 [Snodgrassella alvi]
MPTQACKAWAVQLQENHSVTIAMSCAIVGLSRCAYYYQPKLPDDSVIMSVLSAITDKHLRWAFLNVLIASESSAINGIINACIGCIVN